MSTTCSACTHTHTKQCAEYSANSSAARQLQLHTSVYTTGCARAMQFVAFSLAARAFAKNQLQVVQVVQSNVNHDFEIERSRHNTHCILPHVAMCSCGCGQHQLGCTRSPRFSCKWCKRCKATTDVHDTCNTVAYFLMLQCACSCGCGQHHNTIEQASSQAHTDKPKLS
jgi:hypothetical protein